MHCGWGNLSRCSLETEKAHQLICQILPLSLDAPDSCKINYCSPKCQIFIFLLLSMFHFLVVEVRINRFHNICTWWPRVSYNNKWSVLLSDFYVCSWRHMCKAQDWFLILASRWTLNAKAGGCICIKYLIFETFLKNLIGFFFIVSSFVI